MKIEKFLIMKIAVLAMSLIFSACQKSAADNNALPLPQSSSSPILDLSPTPAPNKNLSIRKIDFKNFTYPWTEEQELDEKSFTLKNGAKPADEKNNGAEFDKIEYGDVTNDGEDEAMIGVLPVTGGNCQCEMVFIYTLENDKPKLLWSFDTWDKAWGGLKKVYAENGELIVETFGDNKFENDKWKFSLPKKAFSGLCCPTAFTKIRFKWNGEKFVKVGNSELFDYDFKNRADKN